MPQRAKLLYALQRTDNQLALKKRRYREIENSLGESQALRNARDSLARVREELSRWRGTLLDRELEAKAVAEKLAADTERLYSGRVKSPRELDDLRKETEYLQRRKADLEDKQLEAMMTVERVTTQVAIANEEYVVIEAAWRADNAELSQEYDQLKAEIAHLLAQRRVLSRRVSEDDMAEYMALRRLRNGVAVVAVRNGMCRMCNVQVPQRDLQRAEQTDELFYCSGCERILYVPEAES